MKLINKSLVLSLALLVSLLPVWGANRIKTVVSGEIILAADWNNEFNNVYTGTIDRTAGRWGSNDDIQVTFGSSQDAVIEYDTADNQDSMKIGLGASKLLYITDKADINTSIGLGNQNNPSIAIIPSDTANTGRFVLSVSNTGVPTLNTGDAITGYLFQVVGSTFLTIDPTQTGDRLTWEGDTADAFESDWVVTDPTADHTVTFPDDGGNVRLWDNAGTAEVNLVFEGATADAFETTITVTDPTADRTITIPDNTVTLVDYEGTRLKLGDDINITFGAGDDAKFEFETSQTNDALVLGLDGTSRTLIVTEVADINTDYAHATSSDPQIIIHSADATDTGDYLRLTVDQANHSLIFSGDHLYFDSAIDSNHIDFAGGPSLDISYSTTYTGVADVYAQQTMTSATNGGFNLVAMSDSTTPAWTTVGVMQTLDTTKSPSGVGLMDFNAYEHDGAGALDASITADSNIFTVRGYMSSSLSTLMLLDTEGDLWVKGHLTPERETLTIADSGDGNPAGTTHDPASGFVEITCNDANGCEITMGETSVEEGQLVVYVNISGNSTTILDSSGIAETAATALGPYDAEQLIYIGGRWVSIGTANN